MRETFTKKFWLLMVALLTAVVLAACSGGDDDAGDEGNSEGEEVAGDEGAEITAWAWDVNFNIASLELALEHYDNEDYSMEIIENAQDDIH